jgi:hydroxymethylpyrimidine pyrophosphatase-like HAD family hydrolase
MAKRLLIDVWGMDAALDNERIVFVGDLPNDEPMFGFFRNSIAVANFAAFADRVRQKPRWLARAPRGHGFAEIAEALIAVRP